VPPGDHQPADCQVPDGPVALSAQQPDGREEHGHRPRSGRFGGLQDQPYQWERRVRQAHFPMRSDRATKPVLVNHDAATAHHVDRRLDIARFLQSQNTALTLVDDREKVR